MCHLAPLPGVVSGIDARFKTKSAYMKFNCESRIRSYMKEVRLLIVLMNPQASCTSFSPLVFFRLCPQVISVTKTVQKARVKAEMEKASKCLVEMLKTAKYNGCYFDRTEKEPDRLCTPQGWFTCQV